MTYNNPTAQAVQDNSSSTPDGTLNQARSIPRNSGFGAATGAQAMRTVRLQVRFGF